jgi:hypothetical protein
MAQTRDQSVGEPDAQKTLFGVVFFRAADDLKRQDRDGLFLSGERMFLF